MWGGAATSFSILFNVVVGSGNETAATWSQEHGRGQAQCDEGGDPKSQLAILEDLDTKHQNKGSPTSDEKMSFGPPKNILKH